MSTGKVKIFCRSFDLKLYKLSKKLYEGLGWECVRLTDQSADGYFYTMLRDQECEIAVNVDEDAFITDLEVVRDLVELVRSEGYANAGFPDGSPSTIWRDCIVTNPFFNVLNLKVIREKFSRKDIRRMIPSDHEPYYPFFYFLSDNFKTLYLPCYRHSDSMTTVGMDPSGRPFCLHTWYSRFYSMPDFLAQRIDPNGVSQKKRIDAIIHEAYGTRGMEFPRFSPFNNILFILNKILRWMIKIPQRVSRWPLKLKLRRVK